MRGLRFQLTAFVLLTVLGAVGLVAAATLPRVGDRMRGDALEDLRATAERVTPELAAAIRERQPAETLDELARDAAGATTSRISIVGLAQTPGGRQVFTKADSAGAAGQDTLQFPAALRAAATGRTADGVEAGPDGRTGEVAVPVGSGRGDRVDAVVVVSRPLQDSGAVTGWLSGRLISWGLVAAILALAAAIVLATLLARRLERLDAVARQVADGDFTTPFPSDTRDEFGALGETLDEMRDQLAELDSARKRFIATASHELRTPLFSLGGFLELLEDEDLPEADRRRFTAQLREQVARLQALATDLLDLSRIDAGSLEITEQPVDLRALARSVAAEFAPAIAAHEAHLELRLPEHELPARCDPDRVGQVLRILINNAITHTPAGTDVVVAVSRRGDRARLSVADHGPGISRQVLPTIFEPFATTDDMQGTGLGLAIASELATRMRGELRVESRPGLTRFTLDLPPASEIPNPG